MIQVSSESPGWFGVVLGAVIGGLGTAYGLYVPMNARAARIETELKRIAEILEQITVVQIRREVPR